MMYPFEVNKLSVLPWKRMPCDGIHEVYEFENDWFKIEFVINTTLLGKKDCACACAYVLIIYAGKFMPKIVLNSDLVSVLYKNVKEKCDKAEERYYNSAEKELYKLLKSFEQNAEGE